MHPGQREHDQRGDEKRPCEHRHAVSNGGKHDRDSDNENAFLERRSGGIGRRGGLKSRRAGSGDVENTGTYDRGDKSLPSGLPRELAQVVEAWSRLPEHVRRTIVDLTRVGRI